MHFSQSMTVIVATLYVTFYAFLKKGWLFLNRYKMNSFIISEMTFRVLYPLHDITFFWQTPPHCRIHEYGERGLR